MLKLGNDQRNRPDQHGKSHGRLGDHAEFNPAIDKKRRHHQSRNDLNQIVVARGEKAQITVHVDDAAEVRDKFIDPLQQPVM